MTDASWDSDRLAEIGGAEELVLVLTRAGRDTLRVPVWPVTVGDDVYVRSYLGVTKMWFRRVQANPNQAIALASGDTGVVFENVDRDDRVNHEISAAFDAKYASFEYRSAMSAPAAVEATLRIRPAGVS